MEPQRATESSLEESGPSPGKKSEVLPPNPTVGEDSDSDSDELDDLDGR